MNTCTYFVCLSSLPPDISRLAVGLTPIVPVALLVACGDLMKMNSVTQRGLSVPPGVSLLNLTLPAPLCDRTANH
jgi:hypothetical protein